MNAIAIIRIAKIVALVGFFMPWLLVSCSGQPILSASGIDLAIGSLNFHNPMNGATEHHGVTPNIAILLAIAALIGGFVFSFSRAARDVMAGLAATSAAGLILSFIGVQLAKSSITHQLAGAAAQQQQNASLEGLLVFTTKDGFTVTVVGLGAALAMAAFAVWSRQQGVAAGVAVTPPEPPAG